MAKTPNYAGFWIRFLAYIIDAVALSVISGLLLDTPANGSGLLIPALYFGAFWMWKAASPGSMLLGMRVVSVDGKPLNIQQVALRLVGYLVSAVVLGIGFITIAFDDKKQGWADKIAKTYVVKND